IDQPLHRRFRSLRFSDQPEFAPFREQASFAGHLPGRVELLPLCTNAGEDDVPEREGLRDPLTEPAFVTEDSRLRQEAAGLAAKIDEMVGGGMGAAWQIEAIGADGRSMPRAARYGDFMLLVRTRTHLAIYERALAAAGIPFAAGSRGALLATLEVRDLVALLAFLVTPAADLQLAQALRSPLFACSDDDLLQLAACARATWWQRLQTLAGASRVSPHLRRAAHLLGDWQRAADRLPAHDLLDRIFHQGEVLARYRLAVAPAARASVVANLRALLLLALDLDGGRYPSLPRFIDELRQLRDADANDAPDEGAIEVGDVDDDADVEFDGGRVRILTIHGAKGLEALIVWLLGANAAARPADAWDVLIDWPPAAAGPRHYSFYGRQEERGAARQALFESEAAAARREELNLLYVAITRARQVFIASGIEALRDAGATPYRRLADAVHRLSGGLVHGDELSRLPRREALPDQTMKQRAVDVPPAAVLPAEIALPAIGERRSSPDAAERFGILLHALLERRTGGTETDAWWHALGFDDGDYRRVVPIAERLLRAPHLQRFFVAQHYRRAWNEIELTIGDGSVQRVDRLVEFDTEIWVVDYKSSGQHAARIDEYGQQVRAYCAAVGGTFPGRVIRGGLIFADASLLEVC
ncbi:MAG: 3'-5' exonuclease, partial [Propionivibrio sp.]